MSKAGYEWNVHRVFTVTYVYKDKRRKAISLKQTASEVVKDIRERILVSDHPSFSIVKLECEEMRRL